MSSTTRPYRRHTHSSPSGRGGFQLPRREKLQEELRAQLLVPASQWSVLQVSNWVSALGLPQYRKRFIHQGVNGSLLLKLDHSILKVLNLRFYSSSRQICAMTSDS